MNDNQYFLKAWNTTKELVKDRGYTISENYDKLSETDLNYLINNDNLNIIGNMSDGRQIFVKFINMIRVKVSYLQSIITELKKTHVNTTIVFIMKSKPSSIIRKLESKGVNNIQIFYSKRLQINPTKHSLVPIHIKISDEETKDVLLKYKLICKSQLPVLLQTDAISRYYNFKKDDIIKIISRQKKDYTKEYKFVDNKLTEKELILEKNLIKHGLIKRRKSFIDRRNELKNYFNNNYSNMILRYRYVK